jgi:hypothetical protein
MTDTRSAAERFALSPEHVRVQAIEIERRWLEHGELWLVRPDETLVRAEYDCTHCNTHVPDENDLWVRIQPPRDYALLHGAKSEGYVRERLCFTCWYEHTGYALLTRTKGALAAQARRQDMIDLL